MSANGSFLDKSGLAHLWSKLKPKFESNDYVTSQFKTMFGGYYASRYVDFEDNSKSARLWGDVNRIKAFSQRRRCNVTVDGTINAFIGDDDYTEDGSNGQVMVYQPKFYYRVEPIRLEARTDASGYHIRSAIYSISDYPLAGYKLHPLFVNEDGDEVDYMLIGAFEGCLYDVSESTIINNDAQVADFATDMLCSVANVKPMSGLTQNLTRANAEKLAQNRGTGWHLYNIKVAAANQLMAVIEFGPNIQTALAAGVTGITDNTSYNCSSYTGSTFDESIGDIKYTGRAASTTNEIGGTKTEYTDANKTSVQYRGVENPFGNIWDFVNGMNMYGDGTMGGGVAYICNDFNYAENTQNNYTSSGIQTVSANGYIKAFGWSSEEFDWLFIGSEVGGVVNGVIGDYHYITANLNGYRIALLGGTWAYGSYAGLFYWNLYGSSSALARSFGARLCWWPTTRK